MSGIGNAIGTAIGNLFGGTSPAGQTNAPAGQTGTASSSPADPFGIGAAFKGVETWASNIGGSVVFVVIGIALVVGALIIFAANEVEKHPELVQTASEAMT